MRLLARLHALLLSLLAPRPAPAPALAAPAPTPKPERAERRLAEAEARAAAAEARARQAELRLKEVEARGGAAEARARQAESQLKETAARANRAVAEDRRKAKRRAKGRDAQAREVEARIRAAEERARAAERLAEEAVQRARDASERARRLEGQCAELEARAAEADARAKAAEARAAAAIERSAASALPELPATADGADGGSAPAPLAEVSFSPGNDCLQTICGQLSRVRRSIDICVFTITDDRIAHAILEAHRRGVKVRVITDNDKSLDEGSDVDRLARAGVPVRKDISEYHMHHKFAVFDGRRMLTGSYNWTRGAARYNEENLIVSGDPRLVEPFTREFEALWRKLGPA